MKLSRAAKPDPTALCELSRHADQVRRYFSGVPFAIHNAPFNERDFNLRIRFTPMLGGINNELFFQGFGGFFALAILILFMKWAFPTKKDPVATAERRDLKASLRRLRRK